MKWQTIILLLYLFVLLACSSKHPVYLGETDLPCLRVKLNNESYTQLRRMRAEAMQLGFISSRSKKEVTAAIEYEGKELPAKVRLKGDWLDHVETGKWSLRVKLGQKNGIMGMKKFSLQHPASRAYLSEWVYHQLLEQEDILTPKYTFVRVWWNDEYKGIFALEEHFDDPLLESKQRRPGPILKYSEEGFWQLQAYRLINGKDLVHNLPDFEAADIEAFQQGSMFSDSTLRYSFLAGRQRMQAYREAIQPASQVLDMDRMARLYALSDIAQAYHSLRWHNLRFYYNPISTKLEPVVFDAYGENGPYHWFSKPYLGFHNERYGQVYFPGEYIIFYLFNEPAFRKQYACYLKRYTQNNFIERFLQEQQTALAGLEKALQSEFVTYHYEWDFLVKGAEKMKEELTHYQSSHPPFRYEIFEPLYEECKIVDPISEISLKATIAPDKEHIHLRNFFCQGIKIKATGPQKNKPANVLKESLYLPAFDIHHQPLPVAELPLPIGDQYVFYEVPGQDFWFRQKINPVAGISDQDISQTTYGQIDTAIFQREKDTLRVSRGTYIIEQSLRIPDSLVLVVEAGVQLDLMKGAAMFVKGGLLMRGTKEQPIMITSTDSSSGGWHLLNCPGEVELQEVYFDHLGEWCEAGRQLTGAITLYETKGQISDCRFTHIRSEDALNVIRSDVDLKALRFAHCRSDALDVDFSSVRIEGGHFEQIGGDAIDLSGTQAMINGIVANSVGDKGLSVGEGSTVEIRQVKCTGMQIGLAVKDASTCSGSELYFDSCHFGVTVFTKKKTYTSASLSIENGKFGVQVKQPYLLEEGHRLVLENQEVRFTHVAGQAAKLLYAQ